MAKSINRRLLPIYLLQVVNIIGFSLLIPILPFVIEDFGQNAVVYGLILSSYSFFQFMASPVLGALSDKYGRKPILVLSQAGTLLAWVIFMLSWFSPNDQLFGYAIPIIVIMISRIIDGITGGNISVATAYVADIVPPKERGKYFGRVGAFTGVGIILGPVIGGFSSGGEFGYLPTAIIAIILSTITLLMIIKWLPESLTTKNTNTLRKRDLNIVKQLMKYKHNKAIQVLFALNLFVGLIFTIYTTNIALYWRDRFEFDEAGIATYMLMIGIIISISQGFAVPKVLSKVADKKALVAGISGVALGILLIWVSSFTNFWVMVGGSVVVAFSVSFFFATIQSLTINNAVEERKGEVTGVVESLSALSRAFAPLIGGILYTAYFYDSFGLIALFFVFVWLFSLIILRADKSEI